MLIAIPVVWILVMFVVGLNNNSSSSSLNSLPLSQIRQDNERIKSLEKKNEELVDIARIHKEKVEKILEENKGVKLKVADNDHPEEERIKAEAQAKNGQVQIHAPKDNNPNAPGKYNSIQF